MMDFGKMLQDPEAMKRFGQTVVLWDFHARKPNKVFHVPGAPLEIRWAWGPDHNYAFTTTALTSKIWLIYEDADGEWKAKAVADIGNPADIPLPVDISLSADDKTLFVDTFMDGKVRVVRRQRSARAEADPRTEDRQAGQHGVPVAGTANASTSPRRCWRTGTRRAPTTTSSSRATTGTGGNSTTASPSTSTTAEAGPAAHHAVRRRQPLHQLTGRKRRADLRIAAVAGLGAVCLGDVGSPGGPGDTATAAAAPEPPRPAGFDYDPPKPGSYRLPPLGTAADGIALDETGAERAFTT